MKKAVGCGLVGWAVGGGRWGQRATPTPETKPDFFEQTHLVLDKEKQGLDLPRPFPLQHSSMAAGTKKAEIEAWFALRFPEETTNMGTKEELEKMKTMRRLLKAQIDAYVKRAGGGNEDSVADVVGTTRLLRFLRSVDGDVKEATKRFSEFLDWREKDEIKPDDVRAEVKDIPLEKFREFVQSQPTEKYCRRALFAGQNFRGDLLSCTIRGGVYPRAMSAIAGENFKDKAYHGFVRYMEWVSHWLHKESVKRGRLVYCCRIWDEGGLSLRHMYGDGIDTIKRASKYGAAMCESCQHASDAEGTKGDA